MRPDSGAMPKWSCRLAPGLTEEHGDGCELTGRVAPKELYLVLVAGEHRGLGAGVSKVRSLKMDRKVWTETLIQVGMPCLSLMLGFPSPLLPSIPHLTDLRTLEQGEPLDNLVGGDFGKAYLWQNQQAGQCTKNVFTVLKDCKKKSI